MLDGGREWKIRGKKKGKKFRSLYLFVSVRYRSQGLRGKGVRMSRVWEICYFLPSLPLPALGSPNTPVLFHLYVGWHPEPQGVNERGTKALSI